VNKMSEIKYQVTETECRESIYGVCPGCGGELEPMETEDNAGNPTFWCGCKKCNCFRAGVDKRFVDLAHQLLSERRMIPYNWEIPSDKESQDYKYWLHQNSATLSQNIAFLCHRLGFDFAELAQLRADRDALRALCGELVGALDDTTELADTLYPYKPAWFECKSKYDWVQEDIITKAQQTLARTRSLLAGQGEAPKHDYPVVNINKHSFDCMRSGNCGNPECPVCGDAAKQGQGKKEDDDAKQT